MDDVTLQAGARAVGISEQTLRRRVKAHLSRGAALPEGIASARQDERGRYLVTVDADASQVVQDEAGLRVQVARLEAELAAALRERDREAARADQDAERLRETMVLLLHRDEQIARLETRLETVSVPALPPGEPEARPGFWRRLLGG